MKNTDKVRGGRASIGEPTEIRASVAEAHKEEARIDHDLIKLKNDKDALLFILADLHVKEKQATDGSHQSEAKTLHREIDKAQKKIDAINGVLPERNLAEDQKKIQQIIAEWHNGMRDWTKELAQFERAEKSLKKNPADGHAQGEANRARAEKIATEEFLNKIGHEAEHLVIGNEPIPAQDESISYSHEQALADRKNWEERHQTAKEEAVPQEEATENLESGKEDIIDADFGHTQEEHDAVLPILNEVAGEAVDASQEGPEVFVKFEPLAEKESATSEQGLDNLSHENEDVETHEEMPAKTISVEEFLNRPLLTDFTPPEQPDIVAPEQTGSADTVPQEIILDATKTLEETAQTMPREILPSDPQVLAYADQQVHGHITALFGAKGFLGIGAVDGMKSANWLDFANRPVTEIVNAKPSVLSDNGGVRIGMANNDALEKIKNYLEVAIDETSVQPEPDETVEKYLKRAAGTAIGKFMNNR